MKTHFTITKGEMKRKTPWITRILLKWGSIYVNAMSKALYPPETKDIESKNDIHRTFYK
ncbi:hypothetical protein [Aquimarina muelleri]|uniref:Uncharacterized protein n=1 Tax=Aquimarina muelleri TaxID=279356 RepID=A0A918JSL1_9FLAO|nr:hypothetical protein [Aquimarina muelleri]MCX2763440.1 hypothetical protein [Aquimarina muelleri]GGX02695.1 hypothetical protein GCM10007384_00530 [Aquimarina muelleri]